MILATTVALLGLAAGPAFAYASDGWVNGPGQSAGTGPGLVLSHFFSFGAGAYNQKWMGAYDASTFIAGGGGEVWCIEAGDPLPTSPAGYSSSTISDQRAAYALWMANHQYNSYDGRAAVQYSLYREFNGMGENYEYAYNDPSRGGGAIDGGRVWNHADFTTGARDAFNTLDAQPTWNLYNRALPLSKSTAGTIPETGTLSNIGVTDPWGAVMAGIPFSVVIAGPAVFNATGTASVGGTTGGTVGNGIYPWHATGDGQVSFTVTYTGASAGTSVTQWSNGSYQDLITPLFGNLTSYADPVTVSTDFTPIGVTNAQSPTIAVGQDLIDIFTVPAANPWAYSGGAWIPATYDVSVYKVGDSPAVAPLAAVPGGMTPLATQQITVTDPDAVTTVNFGPATTPGAYAYVWEFHKASQPAPLQHWFTGDWADQYGLLNETTIAQFDGGIDTVLSDIQPGGGAPRELSDGITLTGFPADHGAFAGGAPFVADNMAVTHSLYFFPDGLAISDTNLPTATPVGTPAITAATNGVYPGVRSADWVVARDANLNEIPGTYVVVSSFTGDSRVPAVVTSASDTDEHYGVTITPLTLDTAAAKSEVTLNADETVTVWDNATISGYTPVGSTIEYDLYRFNNLGAPTCDATTLLTSLAPSPLTASRTYESTHLDIAVPRAAGIGFVATVRDSGGTIISQGSCGDATETMPIVVAAATVAHPGNRLHAGSVTSVWDSADVWGDLPSTATINFELYRFDNTATPVCDATTLLNTTTEQPLPGVGSVDSPRFSLKVPKAAALGFVAVIRDGVGGAVLHRGVCGDATETLPIAVETATKAMASVKWVEVAASVTLWDTTNVWGDFPTGTTIGYEVFSFTDPATPQCDATTRLATVAPVPLTGIGASESGRATFTVPATAAVGFVATVYALNGDVVSRGVCGEFDETLPVYATGYAAGGGDAWILAHTGLLIPRWMPYAIVSLLLAGGAFIAVSNGRSRRRR